MFLFAGNFITTTGKKIKIKENPETESSSESFIDENQRQVLDRDNFFFATFGASATHSFF